MRLKKFTKRERRQLVYSTLLVILVLGPIISYSLAQFAAKEGWICKFEMTITTRPNNPNDNPPPLVETTLGENGSKHVSITLYETIVFSNVRTKIVHTFLLYPILLGASHKSFELVRKTAKAVREDSRLESEVEETLRRILKKLGFLKALNQAARFLYSRSEQRHMTNRRSVMYREGSTPTPSRNLFT